MCMCSASCMACAIIRTHTHCSRVGFCKVMLAKEIVIISHLFSLPFVVSCVFWVCQCACFGCAVISPCIFVLFPVYFCTVPGVFLCCSQCIFVLFPVYFETFSCMHGHESMHPFTRLLEYNHVCGVSTQSHVKICSINLFVNCVEFTKCPWKMDIYWHSP